MAAKFNKSLLMINAGGALILLTIAGYFVHNFFKSNELPPCSQRYTGGKLFALETAAGKALTPSELQARTSAPEWGVLTNTAITKSDRGPKYSTLGVKLAATGNEDRPGENGISFTWPTAELAKASSACLAYSVQLPKDFVFDEPGSLPGLFGAIDSSKLAGQGSSDSFAMHLGWTGRSDVVVYAKLPSGNSMFEMRERWPRGRWVSVEQEVHLNEPGKHNGRLNVWIDGRLRVSDATLLMRNGATPTLSGVAAKIAYDRLPAVPGTLMVSPFIVRWQ